MKFVLALLGLLVGSFGEVFAQELEPTTDFIRYQDERAKGGYESLQTSIVRYRHPDRLIALDLVSVVHVGDAIYFQQLAADLTIYDAIYYEMVGGELERQAPRAGRQSRSVARSTIDRAIRFLGLSYQMDWIDYRLPNFIHADVSWRELYNLMEARNESLRSLFERTASGSQDGLRSAAAGSLTGGDRREPKRAMAREYGEAETLMNELESDEGTSLVADRNAFVIRRIERDLGQLPAEAKTLRQLAIFYGAGHMPDFERRLFELGFVRESVSWRNAWMITE